MELKTYDNFIDAFNAAIAKHSNDDLAKEEGHVTQVWSDAEVTSQKGGSLLNQRTLHMFSQPFIEGCWAARDGSQIKGVPADWPHWKTDSSGMKTGFIYTDDLGVAALAELMVKFSIWAAIARATVHGTRMLPYSIKFSDDSGKEIGQMSVVKDWVREQVEVTGKNI